MHRILLVLLLMASVSVVLAGKPSKEEFLACMENLELFLDEDDVEREYKVIDVIETTRRSSGGVINIKYGKKPLEKAKKKACQLGADAVIVYGVGGTGEDSRTVESARVAVIKWKDVKQAAID